ncbi:MAG: hypothetical protein R3C97_02270 [Geminicoccaceae bacterium]
MSDPAHHSRPSPRAFVDLAHAVTDGRALDDAARISGIDRAFAEWLMQNWAFLILLRIIPFFKLSPNRPSSGNRIATGARTRFWPAPVRSEFSLWRRRQQLEETNDSSAEDIAGDEGLSLVDVRHLLETARAMAAHFTGRCPETSGQCATARMVIVHCTSLLASSSSAFLFFSEKSA